MSPCINPQKKNSGYDIHSNHSILFYKGYRAHATVTAADRGPLSQASVDQQQQIPQSAQQSGPSSSAAIGAQHTSPPVVRVTLASMEECNVLLHNGLDFYGATFFPVEAATPVPSKKKPLASNRYRISHSPRSNVELRRTNHPPPPLALLRSYVVLQFKIIPK